MRQIFAHIHLLAHIAIGAAIIFWTLLNWQSHDHLQFFSFLGATILASVLKVRLPGVDGTVSVNALFILVGIVNLSLPEALALGVVSIFVQMHLAPKNSAQAHPSLVQRLQYGDRGLRDGSSL
jgi:hypothetical protein